MFPSAPPRETLKFSGNKSNCFPRDQSLSDLLYSQRRHHVHGGRRSTFAGNSALIKYGGFHYQLFSLLTADAQLLFTKEWHFQSRDLIELIRDKEDRGEVNWCRNTIVPMSMTYNKPLTERLLSLPYKGLKNLLTVDLLSVYLLLRVDIVIRYIEVDFMFGLPDYVRYIEEFVTSRFVISRFYSTHFTVTLAGT